MTFSRQILLGLAAGILVGLFLGELVEPLGVVADGFVKLLQMTVLPYVTVSIIVSLGSLDFQEAKRLGLRAGATMLGLWTIAIGFAFCFRSSFRRRRRHPFSVRPSSRSLRPSTFSASTFPSNPFNSLANNIVPAVVLFSVTFGVALIGIEQKQVLLDVLRIVTATIARATRFVVRLTPYGIFALSANAAGTLHLEQVERIEVYLITYVAISLLCPCG